VEHGEGDTRRGAVWGARVGQTDCAEGFPLLQILDGKIVEHWNQVSVITVE
jgi:hypothetical protein